MEIEQQIRNTIIQGVLTYDENIFVVEDLDGNLQPDLDCYVRVDVSLSEATGSYANSVLDQGQFTIGDKGVYARIKIDKVYINKNDDSETSNKLFWKVLNSSFFSFLIILTNRARASFNFFRLLS